MINEIKAEFLLTQLYPELDDTWVARHKGTFYRNYSADIMKMYPDEKLVELSRDGLLHILPDNFINDDDELKGSDREWRYEKLKKRLHLLDEAFLPLDTIHFRQRIQIERAVAPILMMKLEYILKKYFNYDITEEKNEYVRQVAVLLPYVSTLRGDIALIRNIIAKVTGYDTLMTVSDYSEENTLRYSIPLVTYIVNLDGLSSEKYEEFMNKIQPLMNFLYEHFMPFDMMARIVTQGKNDNEIILEYNSTIE